MSALESMTTTLPGPLPVHAVRAFPFAAAGFILLLTAFSRIKTESSRSENLPLTRVLLWLILAAGLFLRLDPLNEPSPVWSEDFGLNIVDAKTTLDFPDSRPLIYTYGSRQPFIPYLLVLAYWFFPAASSLLVQKLVWGLVDLAAIWVHYLLGKELGGRRTGLILAAALAFSKPAIINCVSSQVPVSTPLVLGVMLLFTFRFIRKTDTIRALSWGGAVAFGAYGYTTLRPFLWWIPVAVTAHLFLKPRANAGGPFTLQGLGIVAVWTLAFLRVNQNLPGTPAFQERLVSLAAVLAAGLSVWGFVRWCGPEDATGRKRAGVLVLGLITAGLLMTPLLLNPYWATHSQGASVLNPQHPYHPAGGLTAAFWWDKIREGFADFILAFRDREDMGLPREAFWSIHSIPLAAAGLAWAFVRLNPTSLLLLGCMAVGMLPHVLSYDSHTGRLMGVVTPWLLLGALSWDALLRGAETRFRWAKTAGALALVFWGLWSFQDMHHRFTVSLFQYANNIPIVYQAIRKDLGARRVYLAPSPHLSAPFLLSPLVDDGEVLVFHPEGVDVPRFPDGRVPDITVLFQHGDTPIRDRLAREFPRGRLETYRPTAPLPANEPPLLDRFTLDGKDIPSGAGHLIRTVPVPEGAWSRRYYINRFGLGHGVIEYEDWTRDPLAPTPRASLYQTVVIRGVLHIPVAGKVLFTAKGWNYAVLYIDGRRALDYRPFESHPGRDHGSLFLSAGDHHAVLRTYLQEKPSPPRVEMRLPGESINRPFGSIPAI